MGILGGKFGNKLSWGNVYMDETLDGLFEI